MSDSVEKVVEFIIFFFFFKDSKFSFFIAYVSSVEVSLFENTYFVNKLYIDKYVFLHRHFSYMLNFLVQLK